MNDIRYMPMILMLLFIVASLTACGCLIGEPRPQTYGEVVITEGSPPLIRLGRGDERSRKDALVNRIHVIFHEENANSPIWFWNIKAIDPWVPLREVTYGVVPEGFREVTKAIPLEPGVRYRLHVSGFDNIIIYFTNKPGIYSKEIPYPRPTLNR